MPSPVLGQEVHTQRLASSNAPLWLATNQTCWFLCTGQVPICRFRQNLPRWRFPLIHFCRKRKSTNYSKPVSEL